jgi:hypothetical protein
VLGRIGDHRKELRLLGGDHAGLGAAADPVASARHRGRELLDVYWHGLSPRRRWY